MFIFFFKLKLYDRIKPGCYDTKRVVYKFSPMKVKFESLDNCNYAVEVGNSPMNLKLVGIQGSNLLDGNKTYTLGRNFILKPI